MWGNKKPDRPQGADPEPKNLQANQPPKQAPASWEGTSKKRSDAMRPPGSDSGRRNVLAGVEPARER
jgi:hypothetical protein